jgi:3',5'-cyclic AMP phosphodiesterase CpdA
MVSQPVLTRRMAMAGAAAASLVGTAAFAQGAAQTAHGTVFDDADASGRRGDASRGIADVMVSNGRDVVLTDADGRWSLPVADGDAIFVVKPTGWATPLAPGTNLSMCSRLHQPDGTPAALGLRYAGVAPTGPLPASIDFPLRRQTEPTRFNVILFTDPQPESLAELGYVRDDVVAQVAGIDAAFGITTGDLMFDDLSMYPRSNRIVGSIGLPWYNLPGNHDMNYEAPDNRYSRETYKRVFGPRYSAFQYGGVTFFLLDNVEYLGNAKYRGHIGPDQLGFIRQVLAHVPREQLVVFTMHIPLRTLVADEPDIRTTDRADFLQLIADRPATVSFSGHTHTNEHWYLAADGTPTTEGGHHHQVLTAVCGSWWSGPFDVRGIPVAIATDGTPNGFHLLSIDGAGYTTRLLPAHDPKSSQMRLVLDAAFHRAGPEIMDEFMPGQLLGGPIAAAAAGATTLVVNFYNGGPRSKVEFAVGTHTDWAPMQRVERLDPFVQEVYARHRAQKKPWVEAGKSSHIWQARLPAELPPGTYALRARGIDEFGQRHESMLVVEVTA